MTQNKLTVSLKGMRWEQFSKRFAIQIGDLQKSTINILKDAVNGKEKKLTREVTELDNFFSRVEDYIATGAPLDDETGEEAEIETLKGRGSRKGQGSQGPRYRHL